MIPPRDRDVMKRLQARWPSSGYGTRHLTGATKLAPRDLRRCPAAGCHEYVSFRTQCRQCNTPTVSLWA